MTSRTKGMTLVELLIVFAIIGLLTSLVAPAVYRQADRTRAQEEWLTIERAVRDLAFQSFVHGVSTTVEFSGAQVSWRSERGVENRLLFQHVFFDPSISTVITRNGIYEQDRVSASQRGQYRELRLNEWIEFGESP